MSIEEKAEEYRSDTFGTPFKNDIKMAFSEGAQWMQSELIEKAIEWFKHQKEEIGISWFDDYEIRFRKAMEE